MVRLLVSLLAALSIPAAASAAEDARVAVEFPPELRDDFREHMRDHMDSLDDVMVELAAGDFKAAAEAARERLVAGSGKGFGRYLPIDFREMGLGMHRAAEDFAEVAGAAADEPSAADWMETMSALQGISAHCRACHAAFRIE